uniref:Uncharacterized protein n=1 Tax=Panagrolaimus davidi TaxID=227884 RepID=A0A914PCD6_9BILA
MLPFDSTTSNNLGRSEKPVLWNKASKNSDFAIVDYEEYNKQWKDGVLLKSNRLNSYVSFDAPSLFNDKNFEELRARLINDAKQNFSSSSFIIQNPFEFPRQQNFDISEPEVARFRAYQQLINPNEASNNGHLDNSAGMNVQNGVNGVPERPRKRRRRGIDLGVIDDIETQPYKKKLRGWIEYDKPESDVETAEEFIEPLLAANYRRILMYDEVRGVEDLFIDQNQIDKYLTCLEEVAGSLHGIKYYSFVAITSANAELRSAIAALFENINFIIVPIPMKEYGRTTLAVFDLRNSKCWRFFSKSNEKNFGLREVKAILENVLPSTFDPIPTRDCDRIFNVRFEAFDDAILMFHLCEELFFIGHLNRIENLDIKAERRRVAAIFDLINSPSWNHVWPSTLRNEVQASDENLATAIEVSLFIKNLSKMNSSIFNL